MTQRTMNVNPDVLDLTSIGSVLGIVGGLLGIASFVIMLIRWWNDENRRTIPRIAVQWVPSPAKGESARVMTYFLGSEVTHLTIVLYADSYRLGGLVVNRASDDETVPEFELDPSADPTRLWLWMNFRTTNLRSTWSQQWTAVPVTNNLYLPVLEMQRSRVGSCAGLKETSESERLDPEGESVHA
jgi:hypothetical protein